MELDGIETCQEPVRTGVSKLAGEIDRVSDYSFTDAHMFYLLSKFDRNIGEVYLEELWEQYSGEFELHEDFADIPFVAKLERETPGRKLEQENLIELRDRVLSFQQLNGVIAGEIAGGLRPTLDLFWFLVQFDDIPKEVERTKQYVLFSDFLDTASLPDISMIILSLYDLNYVENEKKIRELGDTIIPEIKTEVIDTGYDPVRLSRTLMALSKIPQDVTGLVDQIIKKVESYKKQTDKWWWETGDALPSSYLSFEVDLLTALTASGYGPTISKEEARREEKIRRERQSMGSPEFAATLPSTRFEDRRTEIKSKIEHIVQSCEDSLLISTLQMDMLHDDIFNRLATENDISIRVLTNTGTANGPRTKMKKAVMNEMVNRLDGAVREDKLVHTRMVIGDKEHVVISTADLTRDQLLDSYNAGIYTKNSDAVEEATELFESMWDKAEPRGMKN